MSASCLLPEDQLLCHICKNIFTSPVRLPCGDNLCQRCIPKEWDQNGGCQCPICEKVFKERPPLELNRFISEMANRLRESKKLQPSSPNITSIDISPSKSNMGRNNSSNIGIPANNTTKRRTNTICESNFHTKLNKLFSRSNSCNASSPFKSNTQTHDNSTRIPATNTSSSNTLATNESNFSSRSNSNQSQQNLATDEDIFCSECIGLEVKAVKSCLECLESFCEMHLKPHLTSTGLKRHKLVDPVDNLEGRICSEHNKPLELFCGTDQTIICAFCVLLNHKEHNYVPLSEEFGEKTSLLRGTEKTLNQMIGDRRAKIQDLKHTSKLNKEAADGKAADGLQVFTALKQILEKGLDELVKNILMRQTAAERLTESLIAELGYEVKVLMQRSANVQQLLWSDDHVHVLQSFSSVNNIPAMRDWSDVSVQLPLYEEMVRKAVVEAVDKLQNSFIKVKINLQEAELKRMQKFKVNLTVDPQTADPWLIISKDHKQVRLGDFKKAVPDELKRFIPGGGVVAKQSFCSGRFYFEVQVMDLMKYDLGVVHESLNRKKKITTIQESGHWILSLRKGKEYKLRASHDIPLSLTWCPQRIGLFVDYEEGTVSFYDVDIANLIFSFKDCNFTERLLPYFNPGQGSKSPASLIISPLDHLN